MENKRIFPKVFMWLFVGLFVSAVSGMIAATSPNMMYNIYDTGAYWGIFIAEFVLVIFLSARIRKMSFITAIIAFLTYAILTGLTLSVIFVTFTTASVALIFGITALIFAIFAGIGFCTKIDLSKWGSLLLMALLAIIVVGIINIFIGSSMITTVISCIGVLIFVAYIAYDIQKIKYIATTMEDENKVAIIGALELYLDFINLFIRLLSLFGKRD